LVTVIVALTVPLAINLRDRTRTELENQAQIQAQTIAAGLGAETLTPGRALNRLVDGYAADVGRVIVMDATGLVLADSDPGRPAVGVNYRSDGRPEVQAALDPASPTATAEIRHSFTLHADILVAAAPVLDEGLWGAVRITRDVQQVSDSVRNVTIGLVVIGLGGLLAGLLIAFGLAGSFAKPLTALASAARRLGAGDLRTRAGDIGGASEIRDLAHSFDEMADRVERTVEAQREFVANASHQLRTPLTGMKLRLESAVADATPEVRRQVQAAEQEVDRLAQIVDRLLVAARQIEEGGSTRADLRAASERALERWGERAAREGGAIETAGDPAVAQADPADVDQILDNLLENALTHAGGTISLEIGTADGRAFFAVRDHGAGILVEERARVVERFFRGAGAAPGGSGLGLAIARELAEKWGGALSVQAPDDGGTRIEVRFRALTGS
jgi:signal transduction histidine kinase